MTWAPTKRVLTSRALAVNLLDYVIANQEAAYAWAGNGNLKLIKTPSQSLANRAVPTYPSIAFANDDDATNYTNDTIPAAYNVAFELLIEGPDADAVVIDARIYVKAILSMIVNIDHATLIADTGAVEAILNTISTIFESIKTNEKQNRFLQTVEVKSLYRLVGGAYL